MKKLEELYEIDKLPPDSVKYYELAVKCLNEIEELTADVGFGNIYELEGEDWDEYCRLKNRLVQAIVKIVRRQDEEFDFQTLASCFGESDLWEEAKEEVSRQTQEFLSMKPLRLAGLEERKTTYRGVFQIMYEEYENVSYMSRELEMEEKIAVLYTRVLRFCEDLIFNHCISKRLFCMRFRSYCGLGDEDADYLWELYSGDQGRLEKIAMKNRLNDINYRLCRLVAQMEDIKERLDAVEYMMLPDDEKPGEESTGHGIH